MPQPLGVFGGVTGVDRRGTIGSLASAKEAIQ